MSPERYVPLKPLVADKSESREVGGHWRHNTQSRVVKPSVKLEKKNNSPAPLPVDPKEKVSQVALLSNSKSKTSPQTS